MPGSRSSMMDKRFDPNEVIFFKHAWQIVKAHDYLCKHIHSPDILQWCQKVYDDVVKTGKLPVKAIVAKYEMYYKDYTAGMSKGGVGASTET